MPSLPTGLLALPGDDDGTYSKLRRKLRILALGTVLDASSAPPRLRGAASRIAASLTSLAKAKSTRGAVLAAIGHVDVLAPALTLRAELADPEKLWSQLVPQLLIALHQRLPRAPAEALLWDHPVRGCVVGERHLAFHPPASGVLLDPSGLEIRDADGRSVSTDAGETALFPVAGTIALATIDTNPLAHVEDHPDKSGNAIDLGDHTPSQWCDALREALGLIEVALPHLHAELTTSLQRIVPVGFDEKRHMSASYREAPGLAYLSLHPSPLTLAEALIHETQHGKLNTLTWFDPVLENGHEAWTTSPVRPDLRPLLGVLLAAHAFVPVAALHHRLAQLDHPAITNAGARREEVLAQNREALATLQQSARPTLLGRRVLEALEELHQITAA